MSTIYLGYGQLNVYNCIILHQIFPSDINQQMMQSYVILASRTKQNKTKLKRIIPKHIFTKFYDDDILFIN